MVSDNGIKAEPPSSTKEGSAFVLRPQLSHRLYKEAAGLPASFPHCGLPHLLFTALVVLEIICLIWLLILSLSLSLLSPQSHHHQKLPSLRAPWSLDLLHHLAWCPVYKRCSLKIRGKKGPIPHTHIFPRLVLCRLNPLVHFLLQLTQLHGCLVLGSEIQEDSRLVTATCRENFNLRYSNPYFYRWGETRHLK